MNVSDIWLVVFFVCFFDGMRDAPEMFPKRLRIFIINRIKLGKESNQRGTRKKHNAKASISVEREKWSEQKITTRRLCNIVRSFKQSCFVMSSFYLELAIHSSVVHCDFYCHLSHFCCCCCLCFQARLTTVFSEIWADKLKKFLRLTLLTSMSVSSKCRPNILGASPGYGSILMQTSMPLRAEGTFLWLLSMEVTMPRSSNCEGDKKKKNKFLERQQSLFYVTGKRTPTHFIQHQTHETCAALIYLKAKSKNVKKINLMMCQA